MRGHLGLARHRPDGARAYLKMHFVLLFSISVAAPTGSARSPASVFRQVRRSRVLPAIYRDVFPLIRRSTPQLCDRVHTCDTA